MPREADLDIHRPSEGIFKAALFSLKDDKDQRQLEKYIGPNDAVVGRCSRARCRGKATGYEGHEAVVKPLVMTVLRIPRALSLRVALGLGGAGGCLV